MIAIALFTTPGLVFLLLALLLAGAVLELIRRGKLQETYAMAWLAVVCLLLVFAIYPDILFALSSWLRIDYRTVALMICFLFLTAIVVQYSVILSRQEHDKRRLAQRLARLQQRIEQLERRQERSGESPEPSCPEDEEPPGS
jgi:hypothetical protein